jgi:OmpA-OmpF porin, OOP family
MTRTAVFIVALAATIGASAAQAQNGFYLTGAAGAFWRMDTARNGTATGPGGVTGPIVTTTTFDPGPTFSLGFGYHLPAGFRIEGEVGYAHYNASSANPLSTNGAFPVLNGARLSVASGGARDQVTAAAAGYYDLPVTWPLVPYLGAGVGYFHSSAADARFITSNGITPFTERGTTVGGAFLLVEVGAAYRVADRWSIVPAYRYEHLFVSGNSDISAHIAKIGIRYDF